MRNTRQQTVLDTLGTGPATAAGLAARVGAPVPSIRRTIGTLRAQGYDITTEGGQYVHRASPIRVTDAGILEPYVTTV